MALRRKSRLAALILSNVLLPVAVLIFASGFFPYKPFLPGLATFEDAEQAGVEYIKHPEAVFDRVVFMFVDALRSDFVYGYNSGFEFTQSLIRSGAAIPFTAHATPPTVTMPRVKALTTGSVPSFLDLILNFAEGDTTSSLATQDTWLAQIKAKGGKLVFYGDDTWLKLFPGDFFARADGTSSFFVADFTEVDNNVTRHVPDELARDDWNAMIMHYLGLDHIGHKTGPQGPNMLPKQREMDGIVQLIYESIVSQKHHSKTLLVLAGDHGMNAGGNHGGSGPGETEPALLFASPKFNEMAKRREYECPTLPAEGTEFHYYTKVEQSDIVPALASMMGMPISKNSLGVFISELAGLWQTSEMLQLLHLNAKQLLHIIRAKYGRQSFDERATAHSINLREDDCPRRLPVDDEEELIFRWGEVLYNLGYGLDDQPQQAEEVLYGFLNVAQEAMSSTASSYDIPRMGAGMGIIAIALLLAIVSLPSLWPPGFAGIAFTTISLLYGIMMFASSYVEEEQHFWYWIAPMCVVILVTQRLKGGRSSKSKLKTAVAGIILLSTHRFAVRWNQTGQKHAGEPDIIHAIFPKHHILMWMLVLTTYCTVGFLLHKYTFAGLLMPELAAFANVTLVFLGIVFKLNFTQADAPELVQGLALRIREWSAPFSLIEQAQAVFVILAVAVVAVSVLSIAQARTSSSSGTGAKPRVTLGERLHYLLTLFLMTQTRAPNVPLFFGLELQRMSLTWLLSKEEPESLYTAPCLPPAMQVGTSALIFSHVYYYCMGGSNSISSLDLSNAYNGVAGYNIAAVGVLLFASNWAGPVWWCSAAVLLLIASPSKPIEDGTQRSGHDRGWVAVEREKLHHEAVASTKTVDGTPRQADGANQEPWLVYIASMTLFVSYALLAVMGACTALRTHLFIWTVFSPKYLYVMAWSIGWHLIINTGLGTLLYRASRVR